MPEQITDQQIIGVVTGVQGEDLRVALDYSFCDDSSGAQVLIADISGDAVQQSDITFSW